MKIALSKFLSLAGKDKGIAHALITLDKETTRELDDMRAGYAELVRERVAASNAGDTARAEALETLARQAYNLIDMLTDNKKIVRAAQRKASDAK